MHDIVASALQYLEAGTEYFLEAVKQIVWYNQQQNKKVLPQRSWKVKPDTEGCPLTFRHICLSNLHNLYTYAQKHT